MNEKTWLRVVYGERVYHANLGDQWLINEWDNGKRRVFKWAEVTESGRNDIQDPESLWKDCLMDTDFKKEKKKGWGYRETEKKSDQTCLLDIHRCDTLFIIHFPNMIFLRWSSCAKMTNICLKIPNQTIDICCHAQTNLTMIFLIIHE